jgi:hypothetical protein
MAEQRTNPEFSDVAIQFDDELCSGFHLLGIAVHVPYCCCTRLLGICVGSWEDRTLTFHFGIGVKGMASELHPTQHGFICSLSHDIALGSSIHGVE